MRKRGYETNAYLNPAENIRCLSRASTKRTSGAAECCITWMMPDGFGLAGGRPGWWGSWSRRGESVKGVDKTYHCGGGMLYHLGDA